MGSWGENVLDNDHVQDELEEYRRQRDVDSYLFGLTTQAKKEGDKDNREKEILVGVLYYILTEQSPEYQKRVPNSVLGLGIRALKRLGRKENVNLWKNPEARLIELSRVKIIFEKHYKKEPKEKCICSELTKVTEGCKCGADF